MLVSVRLCQIRLGFFFFLFDGELSMAKSPTVKNPRAVICIGVDEEVVGLGEYEG